MPKFFKFGADPLIDIAMYDDEVHPPDKIPEGIIAISDEDYQDFLENQETKWFNQSGKLIPRPSIPVKLEDVLSRRDKELRNSDWTQLADAPLTDTEKAEFASYRQELRDITIRYPNPELVVFPTKPNLP